MTLDENERRVEAESNAGADRASANDVVKEVLRKAPHPFGYVVQAPMADDGREHTLREFIKHFRQPAHGAIQFANRQCELHGSDPGNAPCLLCGQADTARTYRANWVGQFGNNGDQSIFRTVIGVVVVMMATKAWVSTETYTIVSFQTLHRFCGGCVWKYRWRFAASKAMVFAGILLALFSFTELLLQNDLSRRGMGAGFNLLCGLGICAGPGDDRAAFRHAGSNPIAEDWSCAILLEVVAQFGKSRIPDVPSGFFNRISMGIAIRGRAPLRGCG